MALLTGGLTRRVAALSDLESHMADLTRGLLETASTLRGLVSTARSQMASGALEGGGEVESILRAAELQAARLTIDLERFACGRRPLDLTTT